MEAEKPTRSGIGHWIRRVSTRSCALSTTTNRVEPIHSAAAHMVSLSYRNACPNFHCRVIISLPMHTVISLSNHKSAILHDVQISSSQCRLMRPRMHSKSSLYSQSCTTMICGATSYQALAKEIHGLSLRRGSLAAVAKAIPSMMRSYSLCRDLCLVQGIDIGLPGGHYCEFPYNCSVFPLFLSHLFGYLHH
jgi:hypothetical protein